MNLKAYFQDLRKYRSLVAVVFVFCMIATLSFLATSNMDHSSARATTDGFEPGNIMSDAVMSDYSSMTKDEIQTFLAAKGNCNNTNYNLYLQMKSQYPKADWHFKDGKFVCLSEEVFGLGNTFGDSVPEGEGQTAAEIIYEAAQDYQINPQVLIVLLEKEQGLISDSYPNSTQYRSATGYGCPDTAACDAKYYGFRNQVRNAAAMFRTVLDGGWSNYPAGKTMYVQYNPSASCGGSQVYIENRATSALYRYTPYQPNAAALAAGYGTTGDTCGAYGNRNFYLYFTDWFGSTHSLVANQDLSDSTVQNDLSFTYQAHIGNIGWQDSRDGGAVIGTVGQSAQLEAFKLDLEQNNSQIVYRSHIQNIGWESNWHRGGEISGTTGQSKTIEAVQFQLTDDLAERYDIYYRVHASDIGWMGWTKNGAPAGTTGESRKLEAIQITLVKKGSSVSLPTGATEAAFNGKAVARYIILNYQAHTANIGWMDWVDNGQMAGTTGEARQMEALDLKLSNDENIQYRAYATGLGWMDWVKSAQIAGTTGQSRPIEAVEIKLSGGLANQCTIRYRVHVSDIGWMGWVENGATAGTINQNHRIEAIEVQLVAK